MEKSEFKEMVDKLNLKMKQSNLSLNKALKVLQIPDSTYYDNIKIYSSEFRYDKKIKQIIQIDTYVKSENEGIHNSDTIVKTVESKSTKKENITPVIKNISTSPEVSKDLEWYKKFEEMYKWYLTKKDTPEPLIIDLEQFETPAQYKTIKMYPNVLRDLEKYCKVNKQYKMQDIINAAVLEFMDKHK